MLTIDHVLILHGDLARATEAAHRLGFTTTPTGHHGQGLGTQNTTLMLPDRQTYVELLAIEEPTARNADKREALERRGNHPFGMAFRGDAEASQRRFTAAGLDDGPAFRFVRPVQRGEAVIEARFAIAPLRAGALPGLYAFVCQHFTPELVWVPEALAHPNGAARLRGLAGVASGGARFAEAWRALSGGAVASDDGETVAVTDTGSLALLTAESWRRRYPMLPVPAGADPAFALLDVGVADLAVTRALLARNGVAAHDDAGAIVVPDGIGFGAAVRFTGAEMAA